MVDFSKLKSNSKSTLEDLAKKLTDIKSGQTTSSDDRFWYPDTDKAGNGYAVIRFLPAPGDEDVPFVRLFNHSFRGPTGLWYIENCLTTIGQADPVAEFNSKLWNSTSDDESPARKQARVQKRKLQYISNIYIVQDKSNPENNGKVKLFKYGKKIYDKLNAVMNPTFEEEERFNPFDLWSGANLIMRIKTEDGHRNYDNSSFSSRGPLSENDAELEAIWKSEYSLQALIDKSNFKTYEELNTRLELVLDLKKKPSSRHVEKSDELPPWEGPKTIPEAKGTEAIVETNGDDEDLNWFKSLKDKD